MVDERTYSYFGSGGVKKVINPEDFSDEEDWAIQKLRSIGRIVERLPKYHSKYKCPKCGEEIMALSEEMQVLLKQSISPTGLYIRTVPDLLSILSTSKIPVFLFEVKSWRHKSGNIPIEAFPFGISRVLAEYNVNILYLAVKNEMEIRGKFVEEVALPKEITIPTRWSDDDRERLKRYLNRLFPNTLIKDATKPTGGSGDPYFLIFEKELNTWPLIDEIDTIKQAHL